MSRMVRENVDINDATIMTDGYTGYSRLKYFVNHEVINHQISYAIGDIHTNTIESFWSLLKRGIVGQYHQVSIRYLNQYVNEFAFRQSYREHDNLFGLVISKALGVSYAG